MGVEGTVPAGDFCSPFLGFPTDFVRIVLLGAGIYEPSLLSICVCAIAVLVLRLCLLGETGRP